MFTTIFLITDETGKVTSAKYFDMWEGGKKKSSTELFFVFQRQERTCLYIIILLFQMAMTVLSKGIS